jgi:hypothetical protein
MGVSAGFMLVHGVRKAECDLGAEVKRVVRYGCCAKVTVTLYVVGLARRACLGRLVITWQPLNSTEFRVSAR